MKLSVHKEVWPLAKKFVITGYEYTSIEVVVVELSDSQHVGRGEAIGVDYLGETADTLLIDIAVLARQIEDGVDRQSLLTLAPAGGARNAIDCALWDLECKQSGRRAWDIAKVGAHSVQTVYTLGIDSPDQMAADASRATDHTLLKVKLSSERPVERLRAIREVRPDARIVVDANQGWTMSILEKILPDLQSIGVEMIEQPLPRGGDDDLVSFRSPIDLCADESCLTLEELDHAVDRYQMINIKLDKAGGLTEAIAIARAARERKMGLMVGNMLGTSLAMAPAFVVAQCCDLVDLDGPLLLANDRRQGMTYENGYVAAPDPTLWG